MRSLAPLAKQVVMVGLLTGCAAPLLAPDDRSQVCRVAVEEKYASVSFQANAYANPVGGMLGGALQGIAYGGGTAWIFTVPIGALAGAIAGTACSVASANRPTADADFQQYLRAADAGMLKRSLEEALVAPRACATAAPDTIIEVEKIDARMGCLFGQQTYWFAVQWRVIDAKSQRVLGATTTTCMQKSFRTVDDWFADPEQARVEIERVLVKTGQQMAVQLRAPEGMLACRLQSRETGEVEAW